MKRTLTLLLCTLLAANGLQAQKKVLDHSVYDSWQSVSEPIITPAGHVMAYEVNPQEGDGMLTLQVVGKKGITRSIEIPRGYRVTLLEDESYAVCLIKPYFKETRKAKIAKKKDDQLPKDSLAIVNLTTGEIRKFANVKGYKAAKHGLQAIAFATTDTTFIPKKERKNKEIGGPLAVYHFAGGNLDTLRHISEYSFSKDGKQLGLVQKEGKFRTVAGVYDVLRRESRFFPDTAAWHAVPRFNEDGSACLFLQAPDTLSSGSKHASLFQYKIGEQAPRRLAGPESAGIPESWGITENSDYRFSHNGQRIFVGLQELVPPKDTSLVPFETPGLDIWNWDAAELPPYQKVNLKRDAARTFPAEVLAPGKLHLLNDSKLTRLHQGNRGDSPYSLLVSTPDPVRNQWDYQNPVTLTLDGPKGKVEIATGAFSMISLSPLAKYVLWWDHGACQWHLYDIAAAQNRTLASGLGVYFWDETDDHPTRPGPYGFGGWTEEDRDVLLFDRYDIWRVPTAGTAPQRLTEGRPVQVTYRTLQLKDMEEERHFKADETLLLSLFDQVSKENGFASVQLDKPTKTFKTLAKGPYSWKNPKKAGKAQAYLYLKGNFQEPLDLYYTTAPGTQERKLTAINPQLKDYNWGTVELYHWTAYDGTAMDGLLYKPEDFDAGKKYPAMIYFYERNSENLYTHYPVQPSWSIINIPFYVSRGYVVFVPDIVYTRGLPGESAYNCIVSGAESLTRFPWIDSDNMAIQGQSWGGYQVAYLITRTGMFKAAGAGAPVSNMTSAYGGIRWESGSSRQGQYEQGQSRIGRDLWNGTELYVENSPLFRLPDVTTPVLIMHNDADGAVPWYQGIEMFMGLRRLGKPAWLLQYNNEAHNLRERRNRKDLTIRLQQFFDHYLKGEPAPAWMQDGVPYVKKGYYFGYEEAAR